MNYLVLTFVFLAYWNNYSDARSVYNRNYEYYQPSQRAAPIYRGYRAANPSPQRTMVFHGYYAQPVLRSAQVPEGAMTAFAAGEAVETGSAYLPPPAQRITPVDCGSFHCPEYSDREIEPNVINNQKNPPASELEPPNSAPEITEEQDSNNQIPNNEPENITEKQPTVVTTAKPPITKTNRKNGKPKRPIPEDNNEEDDDEDSYNPFNPGRRNFPVYNSFFPMMFGGGPAGPNYSKRGSSSTDGSSYPAGATAIANSFSTGKGGVATSHATAYGGPRP